MQVNKDVVVAGIVSSYTLGEAMNDLRSRESIVKVVEHLRGTKSRASRLTAFKEEAKTIKSENRKKDFNAMLKVVVNYLRVEKTVDIEQLEMGTLKKLSAFVTFLDKNDALDKKEGLVVTGIGANYNNNLMIKMRAIKAEVKPDVVAKVVSLKDAREVVAELSRGKKEELLALLMEELGYVVEKEREVA
jgi:hypothetical protein